MSNDKIFNNSTADLGVDTGNLSTPEISGMFQHMHLDTAYKPKCCACNSPNIIGHLVPKEDSGIHIGDPNSAMICQSCLSKFDPKLYKIKDMSRSMRKNSYHL